MAGKLVHFEIAAADDGRAMDFYKQVFGWQFQDAGMPGGTYNPTEAGGDPGGAVYGMEGVEPSILVYFDTDDIEASIGKVREAGGEAEDKLAIPRRRLVLALHRHREPLRDLPVRRVRGPPES